jgi:hypothetical protein
MMTDTTRWSSWSRRLAAIALLVFVCLPGSGVAAPEAGQTDEAEARRALVAGNAVLDGLAELARGSDFYLVLDAENGTLRLMLRGAELRTFAVEGVQVGLPRVAFARREAAGSWRGRIWTGGILDPEREIERVHLAAPPPDAEEEPEVAIPPTPEEAYPAPFQYTLAFPGGPALEIRPLDAADDAGLFSRFAAWWVSYWGNLWSALFTSADERVRLRLQLSPDEAGALYRSLPPNVSLIVV